MDGIWVPEHAGEFTLKGYLVAWFVLAVLALHLRAPAQGFTCMDNISREVQKTLAGEDCAQSLAAPTEKEQQDRAQTGQ
jgi:hypothetical protein